MVGVHEPEEFVEWETNLRNTFFSLFANNLSLDRSTNVRKIFHFIFFFYLSILEDVCPRPGISCTTPTHSHTWSGGLNCSHTDPMFIIFPVVTYFSFYALIAIAMLLLQLERQSQDRRGQVEAAYVSYT